MPVLPTGLSGPCPPTADALQTHSTVFQEHAAPSSPGTAPTTRGFRRASEISIASQVSGMAESYTASSIAQSECSSTQGLRSLGPPLCHSRGLHPSCPRPHPEIAGSAWQAVTRDAAKRLQQSQMSVADSREGGWPGQPSGAKSRRHEMGGTIQAAGRRRAREEGS